MLGLHLRLRSFQRSELIFVTLTLLCKLCRGSGCALHCGGNGCVALLLQPQLFSLGGDTPLTQFRGRGVLLPVRSRGIREACNPNYWRISILTIFVKFNHSPTDRQLSPPLHSRGISEA